MSDRNLNAEPARGDRFINLRRLHQFMAVVEEPSLRAAASRLFVSQQGLSAALRQLETELDVTLFHRGGRSLTITPAGKALYAHAPALLAAGDLAVDAVRQAEAEAKPAFIVGHTPPISGEEVYRLIEPLVHMNHEERIIARAVYPGDLAPSLLNGDLGLGLRRGVGEPAGLSAATVAYHRQRVAVQIEHPMAERAEIRVEEMREYPLMVWAPPHRSFYTDFLLAHCRRHGFEPDLRLNPVQGTPPLTAVLAEPSLWAFVTDPPGPAYGGRVRVIELAEPLLVPVQALWVPGTVSPTRDAFLTANRIDTNGGRSAD